MARALFIGSADAATRSSGLGVVAGRNLEALEAVLGSGSVRAVLVGERPEGSPPGRGDSAATTFLGSARGGAARYLEPLAGRFGGLDARRIEAIAGIARTEGAELAWIDSSLFGAVAPALRRAVPGLKIAVYFHNVESDYFRSLATAAGEGPVARAKNAVLAPIARQVERRLLETCDLALALHELDSSRLFELYGRGADAAIPVTVRSPAVPSAPDPEIAGLPKPRLLFVGTAFPPNVEGAAWFVREVLPRIAGSLAVVGKGFEAQAAGLASERCLVRGFVPSLDACYAAADAVVAPIFSGGGMKVKVAEAFSQAKLVIGTGEALRGYRYEEGREAVCCADAEAFVRAIADFASRLGDSSGTTAEAGRGFRDEASLLLHRSRHSLEAAVGGLRSALETIGIR